MGYTVIPQYGVDWKVQLQYHCESARLPNIMISTIIVACVSLIISTRRRRALLDSESLCSMEMKRSDDQILFKAL